jgi:hypothetical protein
MNMRIGGNTEITFRTPGSHISTRQLTGGRLPIVDYHIAGAIRIAAL